MKNLVSKLAILASSLLAAGTVQVQAQFTAADVGSPALAGSTTSAAGGFTISGAGSDIGGTNDQFHFNYQTLAGDFDVKVRVDSVSYADAWSKAGLIARENLTGGSRFAAAFATPNISGNYFQFRSTDAAQSTNAGSFPVTYPNTWLRLRRAGGVLTGFAGVDGNSWVQLGTVTLTAPPASMLVGMAVTSRSTNQLLTAEFRTFTNAAGGTTVTSLPLNREPIGPSTRRTGLIISEIMYHPRTVPGFTNNSLEFIEIFNSQSYSENLTGYRISGSVDYAFPKNTVLKPGQYLVVARDPSFLQSHYGISGVLGPWDGASTNSLPGNNGLVRLRNIGDAVFLEVPYRGANPWPIAADGAGHSLVLSRPSYGEGDPKSWSASDKIDGSPGKAEPYGLDSISSVVINEFLANTDEPTEDFIELFNRSTQAVDLSGAFLSDEGGINRFQIPNGTILAGTSHISFSQSTLGFSLKSTGERLYLINAAQDRVIDAVDFGAQATGISSGRTPDGSPEFSILSSPTAGAANASVKVSDVVINEIMYSPISGASDDEYVELYNRGTNAANLGGWRIAGGISYTMPANTLLPVGGYLVVAKNATNLIARYSALNSTNTVGNFGGTLGNGGERIALGYPTPVFSTNTNTLVITTNFEYVVVNEVTYGDGGRWGQWSDGGGSSLELKDANSDNRQPANWADSDESGKSTWTNVEINGIPGANLGTANLMLIYMLGVGECLLDDVEVRIRTAGNDGPNLVTNPGFESDLAGWGMLSGSHDQSTIENTGFSGAKSLHVRAASRGDDSANSIRTPTLTASGTVVLRAKVKWLRGWPEVLLRMRGGALEAPGPLAVPSNLGSPGARNSRALNNAGPAIYAVNHSPALPAANEPVVVTARVTDPDGIGSVTLKYRVDATNSPITLGMFTSLTMTDDGTSGDAIANDGLYTATLTGRPTGTTVDFFLEAADSAASPASNTFPQDLFPQPGLTRCFPYDNISRECLIRWGDRQMFGNLATYHLWVNLPATGRWNDRHELCNTPLDGTFVYNNYRVVYNCRPQFAGSPWHAGSMAGGPTNNNNRTDYVCNFPEDDRFLGITDTVLNTVGNPGGDNNNTDTSAQAEQTCYIMFREMGIQFNHRRYIHFFMNGNHRSIAANASGGLAVPYIMEDSQQPNGDVINEFFPDDTEGDLYKIEDWFAFSDTGFNAGNEDADLGRRVQTINGVPNVMTAAPYRFMWRKRSVGAGESANDYTSMFKLIDAASPTITYTESFPAAIPDPAAFEAIADVEQWMRIFAVQHAVGNWDSYGYERGKNAFTYKPANGRFNQWTWDIDFTFDVGGNGPTTSIFALGGDGDKRVQGIWNTPQFFRMYMRAFQDLLNGPWSRPYIDPILDEKEKALISNGIGVVPGRTGGIKNYIQSRRDYILGQVTNFLNTPFTVSNALEFTTNNNLLVITGTAPAGMKDIYINGSYYPVTWVTSNGLWTARLILSTGTNVVSIQGYDRLGKPSTNAAITMRAVYDGVIPNPQGAIVFSEIMYNPAAPDASYVELYNSSDAAFDLSGWRVNGIDYTFPFGSVIAGRQYLALVKNRAGFSSAFPGATAFGQFDGNLDLDGETISLLKPGAIGSPDIVIDQIRYEARAPWAGLANGTGPALQLIDPDQDNSRASNWGDRQGWRQVIYTGNIATNGINFLVFMNLIGDVHIDDLSLVTGTQAGVGPNILLNPGFEEPLSGTWTNLGNHSNTVISTTVKHSGNASLHIIANGPGGASATVRQFIPVFTGYTSTVVTCTLSYWYLPSNNGSNVVFRTNPGSLFASTTGFKPVVATPGFANSVADTLPAYDELWLNELQAENTTGPLDNANESDPWIELFNAGASPITLEGYYLADNYDTNLTQWPFPSGSSIAPGEFKIVWADGQTGQTAGASLHTSFRLNTATGSVALVRLVNDAPQITDYLTYGGLPAGLSYGDYPDGQPFNRVNMPDATPGTTNIARPINVGINEWLAGNTNGIADPADGQYEDWFELYNAGTNTVDLSGYWLTDEPGNPGNYFLVPTNGQYTIAPGGFLLVWADNEAAQNSPARADLHVNFQLSKTGESIALYAPDKRTVVDQINFGLQVDDLTEGRFPDGAAFISALTMPTPRAANQLGNGANTPPTLAAIGDRTVRLGQTVNITASATDVDVPAQTLAFDFASTVPAGATINGTSGLFNWTPAENQAPTTNTITLRVTDNGVPAMSSSRTFTLIVLLPPSAAITRDGAGISLAFDTTAGRTYQVQYKNNLNDADWLPLNPAVVASGPTLAASDTITGQPQRFYRIVQQD